MKNRFGTRVPPQAQDSVPLGLGNGRMSLYRYVNLDRPVSHSIPRTCYDTACRYLDLLESTFAAFLAGSNPRIQTDTKREMCPKLIQKEDLFGGNESQALDIVAQVKKLCVTIRA